jgi:16S rRNA (cytidine1402-2'-O)-methyltransferase
MAEDGSRGDGRLVVCPTPIGNLEDVTLRVLAALRSADVVACEDTRRTRVLLERHGISSPLVSYHEHNERRRAGELVARVRAGETVALVSDAGTPVVSDPGWAVLQESVAAGVAVEVLPGPSAVVTALVASALPAATWRFAGFLPRREAELRAALSVLAAMDRRRPAAVCRELTKVHEEVARGTAGELAERFGGREVRGEVVLVVGGAPAAAGGDVEAAADALRRLVEAGARARPAAAVVAELTGTGANALYRALTAQEP